MTISIQDLGVGCQPNFYKLVNPRFHNDLYWDDGNYDLAPEMAIDCLRTKSDLNGLNPTSHAHSSGNLRDGEFKQFLVDTLAPASINLVTIYPRIDCCRHRYVDLEVHVVGTEGQPVKCNQKDNVTMDTSYINGLIDHDQGIDFDCGGEIGQTITATCYNYHLQIAEIEAS